MVKKLILGVGVVALFAACDCKKDCPQVNNEAKRTAIPLDSTSAEIQKIIGSDNAHVRGVKLQSALTDLKENKEELLDNDSSGSYYYFQSDISEIDFLEAQYLYDENKLYQVNLNLLFSYEDDLDKIWFDLTEYFDAKYGDHVQGLQYERYWNESNGEKDLIMQMQYKFPDEAYTIETDDDGQPDTVKNSPQVVLTAKML